MQNDRTSYLNIKIIPPQTHLVPSVTIVLEVADVHWSGGGREGGKAESDRAAPPDTLPATGPGVGFCTGQGTRRHVSVRQQTTVLPSGHCGTHHTATQLPPHRNSAPTTSVRLSPLRVTPPVTDRTTGVGATSPQTDDAARLPVDRWPSHPVGGTRSERG